MSLKELDENQTLVTPLLNTNVGIYIVTEGKVRFSKFDHKDLYKEETELSAGKVDMLTHKENSRVFTVG